MVITHLLKLIGGRVERSLRTYLSGQFMKQSFFFFFLTRFENQVSYSRSLWLIAFPEFLAQSILVWRKPRHQGLLSNALGI